MESLIESLTPREFRVLLFVQCGDSNREIAQKLNISEDAVKYHLKNVFQKLAVRRRTQAVAVAVSKGILNAGTGE